MPEIVQAGPVYALCHVAVDKHNSHRAVDVQKCPCVDSNCPEYLYFADSNSGETAGR